MSFWTIQKTTDCRGGYDNDGDGFEKNDFYRLRRRRRPSYSTCLCRVAREKPMIFRINNIQCIIIYTFFLSASQQLKTDARILIKVIVFEIGDETLNSTQTLRLKCDFTHITR